MMYTKLTCNVCGSVFNKMHELIIHLVTNHYVLHKDKSMKASTKSQTERMIFCVDCAKFYNCISSYETHKCARHTYILPNVKKKRKSNINSNCELPNKKPDHNPRVKELYIIQFYNDLDSETNCNNIVEDQLPRSVPRKIKCDICNINKAVYLSQINENPQINNRKCICDACRIQFYSGLNHATHERLVQPQTR